MERHVSLDLMEFVERNILPRYAAFDAAHDLTHVSGVVKRSLDLGRRLGADLNMAYVVAAYHDLGMEGPRAVHHLTGGRILAADKRLLKWFSPEQINVMRMAVEDHRASSSHAPRNLYGKIVAEADRMLDVESVFSRAILFSLSSRPEDTKEEHWESFRKHMVEKYGVDGYIRLWLPQSDNAEKLRRLRQIIEDSAVLPSRFEKLSESHTPTK